MCGFFAMPTQLLLELGPSATGFKIAFEAIVHGGKNLRVVEVPIVFRDRARGISKMSFAVALRFAFRWLAMARIMPFQGRFEVPSETAVAELNLENAITCRSQVRD
jgi:hypothetical protein